MLQIHRQIHTERFPNCQKLAKELEVSAKTIQRDIEFMRDRLNLPIEYNALKFGFFYTEAVTSFPSLEVTEGEIVALYVAQKALEQYKGTSFEKPLHAAFRKISDSLRDSVTFQWDDLDSTISFRGIGTTETDLNLFESLSKAVLRSLKITFEYKKLGRASHETRQAQPYHLACVENQWYLFAFDLARQQLRTFALPRMRNVGVTAEKFVRPPDFSIANHLGGSFGVFKGQGKHRIRLRFDAFAAQLVGERRWHDSQKITPLEPDDAGIEMTLELESLEEIQRWILSWSGHVQVLAPKELAASVQAAAKAMLNMQEQDHQHPPRP